MLEAETILQNRYQLKQKLGDNSIHQTWLAIDLESPDNLQVVVKLLAFGGQIQWENIKLFEREAQVLKQLNHPHIPKYRDYFCIDDRSLWFALVEDYIPGVSLKELLNQQQRFTEKQVTKIAVDILNILNYLHQLNPPVLHRDIKPSNLILGENEQVYLIDFGAVQDSATKEGGTFTVVGTYGYTPMEQFGGRAVRASDLYALGATLIHLLTGTAPADLPQKDFRIHFSDKVSVSASFIRWIEQLTEPSLERRFDIVEQALDALKNSHRVKNSLPSKCNLIDSKIQLTSSKRIELNKSLDRLIIKIRPLVQLKMSSNIKKIIIECLKISSVTMVTIGLLLLLTKPVLGIFLLGFLLCVTPLSYYFCDTEIKFEFDYFEIKEQLFGFTYLSNEGVTLLIKDISFQRKGSGQDGIILTTSRKTHKLTASLTHNLRDSELIWLKEITNKKHHRFTRYSFGRTLSDAELIWLAQEIRDWLQFQKQRESKN